MSAPFNVTDTAPTFAEQYAKMEKQVSAISPEDTALKMELLNLMVAMKLGYFYGRAEGMREITDLMAGKE